MIVTGVKAVSSLRDEDFPDLLTLHHADPARYPHLLESVVTGTPQARFDILFAFPQQTVCLDHQRRLLKDGDRLGAGDFLAVFEQEWREQASRGGAAESPAAGLPFTGGWFVFLGYELAPEIEPTLARLAPVDGLPVAMATRFPAAVIRDHRTRDLHLVCEPAWAPRLLPQMQNDLNRRERPALAELRLAALHEEPPQRYLQGVERIKQYIRAGDVFQVNLSRLWQASTAEPLPAGELYHRLRAANPAPFAGLMTLDGDRAVVSSSPERLVRVANGRISTRPIAGTYPRSGDPARDRQLANALVAHPKERAEHVMLLDLERNDLGRVCRAGTVKVTEFMAVESYRHVHHIVSEVTGELQRGTGPAQVMRAVFPGGTITGCPKVRCMQIIAELEQAPRGAYTGAMGYVNHDGSMDLNILIRTVVKERERIGFRAGSGIVADSVPVRELQETRNKAKGLLAALQTG